MPDRNSPPRRHFGPHGGLQPAALAVALATAYGAVSSAACAQTLPSGGVAVHGQAVITQPAANQLRVVTQNGAGTRHSAVNWQSFSISAGSTAAIVQPSAASLSINRVVTNTPSVIFGNLSSNGRLVLVNQSGIAVGAGAVIDTAGFTASALRMSDADALAGRLRFGEPGASMGGAASLTVGGRITARDGDVVLVAPSIELGASALLQAPSGSAILAAGQQVEITGRGLEGITMLVQAPAHEARNLGRIEGSAVGIFAGTLRHSGEIQATTAALEGGRVVLKASGDAFVEGIGTVTATGARGGSVDVLGQRVAVTDHAVIDVSGLQGGGSIRVGGDYQGKNPDVPNAYRTFLGPDAVLRADAAQSGDGGRVIVWADDTARAYGTISARGGLTGGQGGFAEVSGKYHLVFEAHVDLRAPAGAIGTLLLDPDFINIVNGGSDPVTAGDAFADPQGSVNISPAALNAVVGNVSLQSNGDITFSSAVNLTAPGKSLTAQAGNMIRVDAPITTTGGDITLYSAAPGATGTGTSDSNSVYVNAAINSNGGTITLRADSCDLVCNSVVVNSPVNASSGSIVLTGAGDVRLTANVIAGGTMAVTAAGGLLMPAVNQTVRLGAGTGQTIVANYIEIDVTGSGTSEIYNVSGPQQITTNGQNGAGQGIRVNNSGTGADTADIYNAAGVQTITVNNAGSVRVSGQSGEAFIESGGGQTIVIQGASSGNVLEVGLAGSTGDTWIQGNSQSITAGQPGQAGSIVIRAGAVDSLGAGIQNDSGTQVIRTTGSIAIHGGSAPGLAGPDCVSTGGVYGGNCGFIGSEGAALQTVSAGSISLFGGSSGSLNLAVIGNLDTAGSQLIELTGGGDLNLVGGGGSGDGNRAVVQVAGASQAVNFVAGGDLTLVAGGAGTRQSAMVLMSNSTGLQSITGVTGMLLTAGAGGGGFDTGNSAIVRGNASQSVTLGSGGLTITAGGGALTDNAAMLLQNGTTGTSQIISITGGGSIVMQGGSSAQTNVGGSGHGSRALIEGKGDSQQVTLSGGGTISLTGGTNGSRAYAQIYADVGNQTVSGASAITIAGGASGGFNLEGNYAGFYTNLGTQTISTTGAIQLQAGGAGIENNAELIAAGNQSVTASGISVTGGAGGGGLNDGNRSRLTTNSGSQTITVGVGGIQLTGGGGALTDNRAHIFQGGAAGTSQLVTVNGGSITLQGGSSALTNVGGLGRGSFAALESSGDSQTINFTTPGGAISATGGSVGSRNRAGIFANGTGTTAITGRPSITLVGGASGGVAGEGNDAVIVTNSGSQNIAASSMTLIGGAGGIENIASIGVGGTTGTQIISSTGAVLLQGGNGGLSNSALLRAPTQALTFDASLTLIGSTGGDGDSGSRIGGRPASNTSLNLGVGGTLQLTAGADAGVAVGASSAAVGLNSAIAIVAGGNVVLTPSATQGVRIGHSAAAPQTGGVSVTATGNITLNSSGGAGIATMRSLGDVTMNGNALTIGGSVVGANVDLRGTTGISLTSGASITASATTGNTIEAVVGSGAFVNSAGAVALSAAAGGRWLVYSLNPALDTRGGLVYGFKQYDALPVDAVLGAGNGFLYSLAPSVTASLVGAVSKTYNGTNVALLAPANYTATGIDGDVITLNNPAFGTYDNKNVGTGKLVIAGGLTVVSAVDGLAPVFGYNPVVAPASAAIGTIDIATITAINGIMAASKVYDTTQTATLTTSGAVFAGKAASDTLLVGAATGTFDTKNVGIGKIVDITGLTLSGADSTNYTLASSTATATASISAVSISTVTGITAANKVYDGSSAAVLSTSGAAFTGRLGSDLLTVGTATGNFTDKNVANPKTVNITGLSLGGADAGNYTLSTTTATTAAAITQATISAVGGVTANKVYDGNISATVVATGATFTGAIAGDNLTVGASSASYSDRNVGTGKVFTASGLMLGGTDAGNYSFGVATATGTGTITQRPLSTWTGSGGDGLWANPLNWDALPDASNVASVSIPAGSGSVTFNSAVVATSLQTISSLRPLAMVSGNLSVSGSLETEDFSQSGGSLAGAGELVVFNSFSQTAGSIAMGNLTIVQSSGNLVFSSLSGNSVVLLAPTGAISQTGPVVANTLTTSSQSGTALSNGGNQISNLYAENLGSGTIDVVNSVSLNVLGLDNAGGNVMLANTGSMATFGPVTSASGIVNLAATGAGSSLGIFADITAGDQVVLSAADTLTQDAAVIGTNGVTADAGLALVFGLFATANYSPVVYRVGGIVSASPPTELTLAQEAAQEKTVIQFVEFLSALVDPPPSADDFAADGKRKDKTDDTIVTEGEVCK